MNYFRQALAMMREEKLYSAMYICGTALAIAFTMLIAEVYYIKVADIAPEVNRSKTYYLEYMLRKNDDNNATLIYWDNFRDLFQKMQTPECVTAVMDYWSSNGYYI
ncbi:MAG: ABC transporter permease, partial [Bacteroidaceae bacterium]|nr:ABC transporter permease [Bacteroidaceae bacterium]